MTPSVALSNTFAKNADIGRRERGCERFNEDKQDKRTEQTGHKTNKTHTGEDGCNDLNPNPSGDQIKNGCYKFLSPHPGTENMRPLGNILSLTTPH